MPRATPTTYADIVSSLLPPQTPAPLLTPIGPTPHSKPLTSHIAALEIHPTLETLLHLLNADLNSAHFLVRHMQVPPKYEGMLLHAVLHRIEGDYDNARAWYGNLADAGQDAECFVSVWEGGKDEVGAFVDKVQELRRERTKKEGKDEAWEARRRELERVSEGECRRLLRFCEDKFGTERWVDATSEWKATDEKLKEIQSKMTIGGEGWRQF